MLLDHRAHGDKADKDGRFFVFFASQVGQAGVCQMLLDHRAHVDKADKDGPFVCSSHVRMIAGGY